MNKRRPVFFTASYLPIAATGSHRRTQHPSLTVSSAAVLARPPSSLASCSDSLYSPRKPGNQYYLLPITPSAHFFPSIFTCYLDYTQHLPPTHKRCVAHLLSPSPSSFTSFSWSSSLVKTHLLTLPRPPNCPLSNKYQSYICVLLLRKRGV